MGIRHGLSCSHLYPCQHSVALAHWSQLQTHPALIHLTRLFSVCSGGKISTLQKSYERNYGWKNHYLINRPSCSELVGNRAYKIHMVRWGFDSASLQPSDSSEKCPHSERANFPLLMTQDRADAINSSYLRVWSLGQLLLRGYLSRVCLPNPLLYSAAPMGRSRR
jgi:hypothetical protein